MRDIKLSFIPFFWFCLSRKSDEVKSMLKYVAVRNLILSPLRLIESFFVIQHVRGAPLQVFLAVVARAPTRTCTATR